MSYFLFQPVLYEWCNKSRSMCHPVCVSGVRCSSVVRAFAHGAMGRRINPSWGGPIELFLVPATGVTKVMVCAILSVGWCI